MRAAATAFDLSGYEATTLARVAGTAGLSLGALTFHFPAKEDLALAVAREGHAVTARAVTDVISRRRAALPAVAAATIEVARLLETNVVVRAAARLGREHPQGSRHWSTAWRPYLERLVATAVGPELREGVDAALVLDLADCLLAGAESRIRERTGPGADRERSSAAWLAGIWRLILPSIGSRSAGEAT